MLNEDQKYNKEIKDSKRFILCVSFSYMCLKKGCLLRDQQNKTDL